METQEFKDILLTVMDAVYHFEAPEDAAEEYMVWQKTGGRSFYASDTRCCTVSTFQVDLYTEQEFSDTVERILETLEANDISFQEPQPQFDPDKKKIRYTIQCEAV